MLALRSVSVALLLIAVSALPAAAQTTWTVDDDGGAGVDFLTIDDALSVAGPNDVVVVRAGVYPPFHMTSPTRLMGQPGAPVFVGGVSTIQSIGAGEWTLVADLWLHRLEIRDSEGTCLLDQLEVSRVPTGSAAAEGFSCFRASDVRAHRVILAPNASIVNSRAQFDGSYADGPFRVLDGSDVHLSSTRVIGAYGEDGQGGFSPPTDGGDAVIASGDSRLRIVRCELRGGNGGLDNIFLMDGFGGNGLTATGGVHEVWDSVVVGGDYLGGATPGGQAFVLGGGATVVDDVPLPSFETIGTAVPGQNLSFEMRGGPDSSARIVFGRFPVQVPVTTSRVDRMVDAGRLASLGAVPALGPISLGFTIPAWPRGTVVFLQTSTTDPGGDTEMSNAVALVVR